MAEALAITDLREPVVPLVANVLADKVEDPNAIRVRLVEQVVHGALARVCAGWRPRV